MGFLNGLKELGSEPSNKTRLVHLCHVSLRREAEKAKLLQRNSMRANVEKNRSVTSGDSPFSSSSVVSI